MPTLENTIPVVSPKTLSRKLSRSSVVFSHRKAAFYGNAIPRLERAQKVLHERLCALREPIEMLDKDGNVVRVHDDKSLCATVRGLIDVIEAERALLGFPRPGRRRNEGERSDAVVHAAPAQAIIDATERDGSAGAPERDGASPPASAPASPCDAPTSP